MPVETARLRDIVVRAIAAAAEVGPDTIDDGLDLFDLGLDSLNLAGILIDIEDGIGAEIPAEVLDRFLDVGDVLTVKDVTSHLAAWERGLAAGPVGEVIVVPNP